MHKQILFLSTFFIYMFSLGQTQIGQDIDGEQFGDFSGISVDLSSNGSILAIGASQNDGNGSVSGHVRVYEDIAGVWTQIGDDIDGESSGSYSGTAVKISDDGSVVAIGATGNNGNGSGSGHVRIYENIAGVWTQIGSDIDGESPNDASGFSLGLSSDGTIVAIGSPFNGGGALNSGHVRVFENIAGVWTQIGSDIDGEAIDDESGFSVDLSNDGSIVAIGARGNDGNGANSGHVRVFENIGGVWTQIGSDIDGEAANDLSGYFVSLSSNGDIIAISAQFNDGVNGSNSGHVRVFENIAGVWTQIGNDIDGEAANDLSGDSISLSSDGTIIAIGTQFNDGNGGSSGHVRVFKNNSNSWIQIGTDIDGEAAVDYSGSSVSLSQDGSILAVGARNNDGNGSNSGHTRVYDLSLALSQDTEILSDIYIYPNPANDHLNIELKNGMQVEHIHLYTTLGQLVHSTKSLRIITSKLSSGMYLLDVSTSKGRVIKKIFIE